MNAEGRAKTLDVVGCLLDKPGADVTWAANDQVLGGGAVVTVTVRAVVSRDDLAAAWPQRHVLGVVA